MIRFIIALLALALPCLVTAAAEAAAPIVLIYETAGKKSDGSFIEMARQGAARARQELGLEYEEYVIRDGESREKVFRHYASAKAELIIALGFQNVATVLNIAEDYPATSFTIIDGLIPPLLNNVQSVVFRDNEGAFMIGVMAAMHSKSKKLGFIGGMDVPLIRDFAYGFQQGAMHVDKNIEIVRDMIGNTQEAWSMPQKAGRIAQRQIAKGADIIFAAAGGSGVGMLEKVSHYEGVYSIGVDFNQNGFFPGSVLTSLVKRVDKAVYNAMRQRSDNSWQPGVKYLGIKEGALDYAVDENNRKILSPQSIEEVERIKDYIIRGVITVDNYRAK